MGMGGGAGAGGGKNGKGRGGGGQLQKEMGIWAMGSWLLVCRVVGGRDGKSEGEWGTGCALARLAAAACLTPCA